MNRKIKFRGKDCETGEWLYGNLIQRIGRFAGIMFDYEHGGKIHYAERPVKQETVGQLIGLYDSNGNEIYEGDILLFERYGKHHAAVVKWNDEVCAWCLQLRYESRIGSTPLCDWLKTERLVCIGNVHDNPELLKGK